MKAYVFPGQGAQFVGMGKDLYESSSLAKDLFEQANNILGFNITDLMFNGTPEDLRQTKVTQPAVFLHSVISALVLGEEFKPDMVAGHSLGEFSALVAAQALSFEDGLRLVSKRAMAMQKACELEPSTMAAIIGLPDDVVDEVCDSITDQVVVAANFNCPGQIVISGTIEGIDKACAILTEKGAKRALKLSVGGKILTATLVENSSVDALKNLLTKGDLTIEMEDYASMEKVGALGTTLPRNDEYISTVPGDLILYQGRYFVIYYGNNSYSLTRLGKINGITQSELKAVLGNGDVTVTLALGNKE